MEENKKHKCLLYWHRKAMGSLVINKRGDRLVLYPGYNSFDFDDLEFIYTSAKTHFERGVLSFYGITQKAGKFVETTDLTKLTLLELNAILDETYNPDTLVDLSDPAVVGGLYTRQAAERKAKLAEAKGTEADKINEVK